MVIISTIIVSTQLDFMRNKKLGFDKENLVYLRTGSYFSHKYDFLRQDLLQSKHIINLTVSNDLPTYVNLNTGADWEGKTEDQKYIGFQTIYEIHFLDQTIDQLYTSEKKIKRIFSSFAFLAVFISCLGLFGLASFISEQRTK